MPSGVPQGQGAGRDFRDPHPCAPGGLYQLPGVIMEAGTTFTKSNVAVEEMELE